MRLKQACGASARTIARSIGVGHTAAAEYLRRTAVIGITWPVPAEIEDAELERRLFAPAGFNRPPARITPDWNRVHVELQRRGVTLLLLWEEYRSEPSRTATAAAGSATSTLTGAAAQGDDAPDQRGRSVARTRLIPFSRRRRPTRNER